MTLPMLYARSTTGKISQWQIEFNETGYRTISGFTDGKNVTSEWTICVGKSYNTQAQQSEKEARAVFKKKVESGMFENIEDVDNETFFEPMLAKEYAKEKAKMKFPIGSSKKLDGMRCIIKRTGMWSRTGKRVVSAPHIFESLKEVFKNNPDLILDGELYCDKLADNFNKIMSCVKKTKPEPEDLVESAKYIQYWVYDMPSNKPYIARVKAVEGLINDYKNPYLFFVGYDVAKSHDEIEAFMNDYIAQGYEGQILRVLDSPYENKRSKFLIKNKIFITEEFKILDIKEGVGKLKGKAGTCIIRTKAGVTVEPTINGDHEFLENLWSRREEAIGKEGTIRYTGYTEDGSLRFPKLIEIDRWSYE